jgi:hypothetical protein
MKHNFAHGLECWIRVQISIPDSSKILHSTPQVELT